MDKGKNMAVTIARKIENTLHEKFYFDPTNSQVSLLHGISRFVVSGKEKCLLVVKGYAGTGKTTTVNALIKTLPLYSYRYVMLAPTGRAAKVMSAYTRKPAFTIHKKIYFKQKTANGGVFFVPSKNLHTDTIFIVDEASMIGAENYSYSGGGDLLTDLMEYVFSGKNCRLILIGDAAQLPPVGSDYSPALDLKYLKSTFFLTAASIELVDVIRQSRDSGILNLATSIREAISSKNAEVFPFDLPTTPDLFAITGNDLQEALEDEFSKIGPEGAILITRSNKRANQYNKEIRARVFFYEEDISGGDYVMAVRNNYHWLDEKSQAGFIANGDVMEIVRLGKRFERYSFAYQEATVRLIDYPMEPEIEVLLWLDSLDIDGASMPKNATDEVYRRLMMDYSDLPTKKERIEAVKEDPVYNALQIKFSYAVTCHKSQGGQWPAVFVDQGYLTEEMIDTEYMRWLYTAVTRASQRLYLLNFKERLFRTG
ncbi:MAG: AAA family ATPase [Flavobacteriales bacterium]|nr:AAA family ATPase [Flavobacteriales bacterium]